MLALFLLTGALLPFLYQTSGSGTEGYTQEGPITQIAFAGIYAVTFLLIMVRWRYFVYIVTRDRLLLLLLGLALVSILWSIAPELTLRRCVGLIGTVLFGAYLATRYNLSELLQLLAWALGVAALLSVVFALVLPSYGIYIDERGEAWQGIYWHKNALGRIMALSGIVFLILALSRRRYQWIAWVGFGLSVVLLWLSHSVTPLISLTIAIVIALGLFYITLRWHYTLAIPFFILVVLTGGFVATLYVGGYMESLLEILGRDDTLSGRTVLWNAVLSMIWQRPWLGYGYAAFWQGWEGESAHVLLWMLAFGGGQYYGSADNGYLQLWLDLGLLGVVVFACQFLLTFSRAIIWARLTKTVEGFWPLTFLVSLLVQGYAESSFLGYNSITTALYVCAALYLAAHLSEIIRTARIGKVRPTGATSKWVSPRL